VLARVLNRPRRSAQSVAPEDEAKLRSGSFRAWLDKAECERKGVPANHEAKECR